MTTRKIVTTIMLIATLFLTGASSCEDDGIWNRGEDYCHNSPRC